MKEITLSLNSDEALVLFGFLGRFNELEPNPHFVDQAEQRVLWDLECLLEKVLTAPFAANYQELLLKARDQVRDKV